MQTPANLSQPALITNDLPYFGFLGWGNNFYGFDDEHFFGAQWMIGWVGEEALAEQTQKAVHSVITGKDPKGWDNQLDFEPDLNGFVIARKASTIFLTRWAVAWITMRPCLQIEQCTLRLGYPEGNLFCMGNAASGQPPGGQRMDRQEHHRHKAYGRTDGSGITLGGAPIWHPFELMAVYRHCGQRELAIQ